MGYDSDEVPHRSAEPIKAPAPVDDAKPNVAMLKGDIDSGRTGDKNQVFDPGLSPLGTDDEAGGTPPTPARVRLARLQETLARWRNGASRVSAAHNAQDQGTLYGFIGLIAVIGVVIVAGMVWAS